MRNVQDLFGELARIMPVLGAVQREHIRFNRELLPHVLMADILGALARMAEGSSEAALRPVLELLDLWMTEGDEEVQNVIALSFLEHLGTDPDDAGERRLREWLTPSLRAELDAMEAWVPDPMLDPRRTEPG